MAVVRVHKTKDYTTMSNYHFKNHEMSLKSKGLLSLMLSLPDDWDYSIEGLTLLVSDGKDSIRAALKELEEHNYLRRTRRTKAGKFDGYEYDIYEKPLSGKPLTENPTTEKPTTGKPLTENPTQLNTNKSNTNKSNNSASAEAQELFERLWKLYPRKKGKSAVKLSTKKKLLKVGEEKLTQAIGRYSREVEGKEEQYILMGSTFFNGRYEDYLEEPEVKPKKSKVLSLEELEAIENGKRT